MRFIACVFGVAGALIIAAAILMGASPTVSADAANQLARGKEMFRIRCEPCHGDVGQGLAIWRYTWAPEDQNCSQYKCHALNHPPDGFYMPNDAPPIIGAGTLKPFPTARELHTFVSKTMPFDKPGELSPDDYWAVTAFLLQQNNKLPAGLELSVANASAVIINPALAASTPISTGASPSSAVSLFDDAKWLGVVGVAGLLGLAFFVWRKNKR